MKLKFQKQSYIMYGMSYVKLTGMYIYVRCSFGKTKDPENLRFNFVWSGCDENVPGYKTHNGVT